MIISRVEHIYWDGGMVMTQSVPWNEINQNVASQRYDHFDHFRFPVSDYVVESSDQFLSHL